MRSRDMPTIMISVCAKHESNEVESIQRSLQSNGCHVSGQDKSPNMVALFLKTIVGLSQRPYEIDADDELHIVRSPFMLLDSSFTGAHSSCLFVPDELHDGRTMWILLDVTRVKHGLWMI